MLELNFSPFPEIITERLLLRKVTKEDAEELFFLRSNEDVMKYIDRPRAQSVNDAMDFLEMIDQAINNVEGISWAIALKENPTKLIGTIGYWRMKKEHYRAELGYMLNPAYWRQGIMKEAIFTLIDYGFNAMKLHSIEANINAENEASARILESTGFIKEAHFKEDYFFNGVFKDTIIYSRLK
jgi:ribosomal-protein-alanine N-acetyltransferase